jgi:surface protein
MHEFAYPFRLFSHDERRHAFFGNRAVFCYAHHYGLFMVFTEAGSHRVHIKSSKYLTKKISPMKKQFSSFITFIVVCLTTIYSEAAIITVTNTNNSGAGSLRQAVIDAAAGDEIRFSVATNGNNIVLSSSISFSKNLTITGNGIGNTVVDGGNIDRIFWITGGVTVNISGLIVQRGRVAQNGGIGGGILCTGNLNMTNCWVRGNQVFNNLVNSTTNGGGIYVNGDLDMTNCVVSGNFALSTGGGIYSTGGSVTLTNTTLVGNSAFNYTTDVGQTINSRGGGINFLGGSGNTMTLRNSIVWDNYSITDLQITGNLNTITYQHSIVQDMNLTSVGTGNLNGALVTNTPNFIYPNTITGTPSIQGDFRLLAGSAPIDRGNNTYNNLSADIAGVGRTFDGDMNGTATIDMGAYEFNNYPAEFITEWKTDNPGSSADNQITIPVFSSGTYNYNVVWGDGTVSTGVTNSITHTYPSSGTYTVIITGTFPRIYFNNVGDSRKILSVLNWGNIQWSSMLGAFFGCSNLTIKTLFPPNLSGVSSMESMFRSCSSLNAPTNINTWNTASVTNMTSMFAGATSFNQNIDSWNTVAVTNMSFMFFAASAFNRNISSWNTGNVTNMSSMFVNATSFNQNLGNWTLNSSVNMASMLNNSGMNCTNYSATLIGWAANNPTVIGRTLGATGRSYNSAGATARNQLTTTQNWTISGDIIADTWYLDADNDGWYVSTQNACSSPGAGWTNILPSGGSGDCDDANALVTNQCHFITQWTFPSAATHIILSVQTAGGAVNYTWSASPSGNSGSGSFTRASPGSVPLSGLTIAAGDVVTLNMEPSNLRWFYFVDQNALLLTDVSQWGTVPWTSMELAFFGCSNLQVSATDVPNLSGVASMNNMFRECAILNTPANINTWNTATVTNMSSVFNEASAFNQDISGWNTGNVTDMSSMFTNATSFNQNLGNWTLNSSVNMGFMLNNSGMNCSNYSATLIGWAANNPSVTGRTLGATGRTYNSAGATARSQLTTTQNWTITDAGLSTVNGTDVVSACNSYIWIDGNTYTTNNNTATYTIVGGTANGCDSLVTLNLTINNPTSGTDIVTACDSYTWIDGNTYTTNNNTATFNIVGGAANSCDSLVTLNLSINNTANGSDVVTACDSYTWIDGNTYTTSNNSATYNIVGGAANSCDSLVTLNLSINNTANGSDVVTACDSYTWIDGNTYSTNNNAATFNIVGGAANGCDSLVTLNLTISNIITSTDVVSACETYTWIDGNTYTSSNNTATFNIVGGAVGGCDSLVTLDLTINPLPQPVITQNGNTIETQVFDAYQWFIDNTEILGADSQSIEIIQDGDYSVVVIDDNGCSDTSNVLNIIGVGIHDFTNRNVKFYPNPVDNTLYIESDKIISTIKIFDVYGRLVFEETIDNRSAQFQLLNIVPGAYLCKIFIEKSEISKTLIKTN